MKTRQKAVLTVLGLLLSLAACPNWSSVAWKSTATVREIAVQTEAGLAEVSKAEAKKCLAKHGAGTPGYAACVKPYIDALNDWIKIGRPAVNSALILTVASIQLAEKNKTKVDWLEYLKPAVCAVSQALDQWGKLLPEKTRVAILLACKGVAAFTCEKQP